MRGKCFRPVFTVPSSILMLRRIGVSVIQNIFFKQNILLLLYKFEKVFSTNFLLAATHNCSDYFFPVASISNFFLSAAGILSLINKLILQK